MKRFTRSAVVLLAMATLLYAGAALAGSSTGVSIEKDELRLTAADHPDALVTLDGRLLIDGQEVPTSPQQRALLQQLHAHTTAIGDQGQAIGEQADEIAADVMAQVLDAIRSGRARDPGFEAEVEAAVKARLAGPLEGICGSVDTLLETADAAVASGLVELLPYIDANRNASDDCWNGIASAF